MSNYDHYAEARSLADQIEAQGFADRAKDVRSSITCGRSGTEIFMQLRFYLTPLLESSAVTPSTRAQLAVLLEKINEALAR